MKEILPKNVVVVVPHGDDEILSAGATISKHVRTGDSVSLCILKGEKTDRNSLQLEQSIEVSKFLKLKKVHHLNAFKTNDLSVMSNQIENFLLEKKYDVMYTIYAHDNHQEHRLAFDAINIAVRAHGPCPISNVFCGETLSSTSARFRVSPAFSPTYYNVVTKEDIETKINALKFYTREIHDFPHPRSIKAIKALATLRGSECFNEYAEAFVPLRQIVF